MQGLETRTGSVVLTTETTVEQATEALDAFGPGAGVVMDRGGQPVGVVTTAALRGRFGRVPRPGARLVDVMDLETVRVDPGAEVLETLRAYTDAAWSSARRRRPGATETLVRRAAVYGTSSRR